MTKTTGTRCRIPMLTRAALSLAGLLALANAVAAQTLVVPEGSGSREVIPAPTAASSSVSTTPSAGAASPLTDEPYAYDPAPEGYHLWDAQPPIPETTGTALDRGFWYSQAEAVVMVRQWNRQRLELALDTVSARELSLGRSTPGREGSVRFTLGRFLFRDGDNRDHTLEFTVLGGGEFGQNSSVFVNNAADPFDMLDDLVGGLVVPVAIDLGSTLSFDGAESSAIQYDSRLNSFELNYSAQTRLRRDRMELLPTGQWVRRANSGLTMRFLGGVRYIDLTENIAWTASNIDSQNITNNDMNANAPVVTDIDGEYLLRTSNDIFGPQLGFGVNYTGPRFSVESLSKFGILGNDVKTRAGLNFSDPTGADFTTANTSNSNRTDSLSLLAEYSLVGRYHFRPNISLRAGYHLMYLTQVALAPHQIDFAPDNASVAVTGNVFYHGISTGLDFYW